MKNLSLVILALLVISPLLYFCGDVEKTVKDEFAVSKLLKKYEYFKDLSSAIDNKRANILLYESQLKGIKDKSSFQYQQMQTELMGIITIHNNLCSEYNSAMSKFNYAFCNKGTLPESNLEPLPREFKPYITNINQ